VALCRQTRRLQFPPCENNSISGLREEEGTARDSWERITLIWNQVLPTRCVATAVTNASATIRHSRCRSTFRARPKPADFPNRSAAPLVEPQASSIELPERSGWAAREIRIGVNYHF
jgi:hypothetical protein